MGNCSACNGAASNSDTINMRVLITGTSGRSGRVLAQTLAPIHDVIGIDKRPGAATTHVGDIADRDFVLQAAHGAEAIIHTASLHAPDVPRTSKAAFIQTNLQGTFNLLDAGVANQIRRFVYTSTTSLYGYALVPTDRAVWVTEALTPQPRDIYDVTKLAAEQLCQLYSKEHGLCVIGLRTSRFFEETPELVTIYRLYRGVDVRDVCAAHRLALTNEEIQFDVFNISARSPFQLIDTPELLSNADRVITRYYPQAENLFRQRGWLLPKSIDRVYVISKAEAQLGYEPRYNFAEMLDSLK